MGIEYGNKIPSPEGLNPEIKDYADSAQISNLAKGQQNTMVPFGDSITFFNEGYRRDGFLTWANYFLNNRIKVLNYAGIGGNTTAQMLDRIQTDVIDFKPAWCHVLGGTNDLLSFYTSDVIIGNLTKIVEMLLANNIKVIIGTIIPGNYDATQLETLSEVNHWIKHSLATDCIVVDYNMSLIDLTTGNINSSVTDDNVHPNAYGAILMGETLSGILSDKISYFNILTSTNNDAKILNANPMMLGDTVGVADNIIISGTGYTASKIARTDRHGMELQRVVVTDETAVTRVRNETDDLDIAGKNIMALVEFKVTNITNITQIFAQVSTWARYGSAIYDGASSFLPDELAATFGTNDLSGVIAIGPINDVNALAKMIRIDISVAGTATIDVGRMQVYEA